MDTTDVVRQLPWEVRLRGTEEMLAASGQSALLETINSSRPSIERGCPMGAPTAQIVLGFTSEIQARDAVDQHKGDNGCDECPPWGTGTVRPLPDAKQCPVFRAAIAYLTTPIEPDPVLPEVRFDAKATAGTTMEATQVFGAVIDLDPADFYRPREFAEMAQ